MHDLGHILKGSCVFLYWKHEGFGAEISFSYGRGNEDRKKTEQKKFVKAETHIFVLLIAVLEDAYLLLFYSRYISLSSPCGQS